MASEKPPIEEPKPSYKEGEFDEHTSYSFFFFLCSGAALFVTLWAFWDDEYFRRGYKDFQEQYYQEQYNRTRAEYKAVSAEIDSKEAEIRRAIEEEENRLDNSGEYQKLADAAFEAQTHLDEAIEKQKFDKSRLDEYYYYYKKAQHEGKNFEVQLNKVHETEDHIKAWDPIIEDLKIKRDAAEEALLQLKGKKEDLENNLIKLVNDKVILEGRMDYYKPFGLFLKPSEILQTVIPGSGRNNFSEIIYKVDRCHTCHIAYNDPHYAEWDNPLKSHPNIDIYIKKHDPTVTGCTWCHKGQGVATAPAEDAHGSHHEMDQTLGINEPIMRGALMQANCRNCHAQVLDLEGAPKLSKGKHLFVKLGCHGCHLAEGYENEAKVGPSLFKIGSKVDSSWLYRWVKEPRDYLPTTRMPDFNLNDEDTLAISAYLLSQSEKGYKPVVKYKGGDAAKGKKAFGKVGCQACHSIDGVGENHAPDLSNIANKVNADWLVSWISKPHDYNPHSKMPDLQLDVKTASNIAAYLLEHGKPETIPGLDAKLRDPENVKTGEVLVRRRGCFACHEIHGMEKEGRIAPELSSFGIKQTRELEFGDTHIPQNWESWTSTKLHNPSAFRTDRVLDKMPNFNLAEDEIEALMVLLKGFNGANIPQKFRRQYSKKELIIEKGRRLIHRYNCRGCHVVEGSGGDIQKYLKAKTQYPPPLEMGDYHVGERIKGSWLYSFLKKPTPVRTWVKVKMPKFAFTDQQIKDLTAYFEAVAPLDSTYEKGVHLKKDPKSISTGEEMVEIMDCGKCHDEGAKGIAFSIASERLRENWIPKWIKDTRKMIPWTKMPDHYPKEGETYTIQPKFRDLQDIQDGDVDKQLVHLTDYLVAYNNMSGTGGEEGMEAEEEVEEEEFEEDEEEEEDDDE